MNQKKVKQKDVIRKEDPYIEQLKEELRLLAAENNKLKKLLYGWIEQYGNFLPKCEAQRIEGVMVEYLKKHKYIELAESKKMFPSIWYKLENKLLKENPELLKPFSQRKNSRFQHQNAA